MDYNEFLRILKTELPLNRKERFYTGTVLPALLFHNGLENFYRFLDSIEGFPHEINEVATGDNFLFYTEYNLRESAGDRNIGRKINAPTNDTPDIVVMILKPVKVFIIIEAKMFAKVSQEDLRRQILRQKKYVGNILKEEFLLEDKDFYYLALVPKGLGIGSTTEYQVVNWEFFIDNEHLDVQDNLFYNYLKSALKNYKKLVSDSAGGGQPTTVEFYMKGLDLYELDDAGSDFWVGRTGGEEKIKEDRQSGKWRKHKYCVNSTKPSKGQPGNWIQLTKFRDLIDKYQAWERIEDKGTTRAGFINPNQQQNLGPTQPPIEGTDYGQYVYIIQCTRCGLIYGANGSDIWERKCPKCQGGKPGIPLPVN